MVKRILSVFAISTMMIATSCSSDEFDAPQSGNETTVSFTTQLPTGLQSKSRARRVAGDGTTATTLSYAVYEVVNGEWNLIPGLGTTDDAINRTKTVSLRLVNGNEYAVVFWADAQNSIYEFNATDKKVVANYTGAASNDEKLDAFYAVEQFTVTGSSLSRTVELKRPFAQLNIGTADLEAAATAGRTVTKAGIKVNTYNTLNFEDGSVEGEAEVNFGIADFSGLGQFPVEGDYEYLTMNYLLMPTDKKADNSITISYDNASERTFHNVPLQRNYRTNIYGNLLTSNENFNIEIKPDFDGEHNESVWDGTTVDEPTLVEGTYQVSDAAQWIWLTKNGIGENNITLTNDLDFGGQEISNVTLLGTFDGNGHTMSNMAYVNNGREAAAGMFSVPNVAGQETVTIKNVTIKGAKVNSYYVDSQNTYGYAGAVIGCLLSGQNVTLDNVVVEGAEIKGIQGVGGLVGIVANSELTVKNSSVKSSNITNYSVTNESGYVATLVGKCAGTVTFGQNVVSANNKVVGIFAGSSANRPESSIDEIAALRTGTITGKENVNTSNNKTIKVPFGSTIINTAAELVAFAKSVNDNDNIYTGKTIFLCNDIDLAGINWTPISQTKEYFNGTFDGCGHTIKNLTINEANVTDRYDGIGFFGWLGDNGNGAVVKNLNFDNANVKGSAYVGVICGYNQFAVIENCKVTNSHVTGYYVDNDRDGNKCGGIVGIIGDGSSKVKNCAVSNSTVKATRDAGQVVGAAPANTVLNCTATEVSVTWNGETRGDNPNSNIKNEITGRTI